VADATVTAAKCRNGVETVRKTTEAGFFGAPSATAGEYTVTVKGCRLEKPSLSRTLIVDALAIVPVIPNWKIGMAPSRSRWRSNRRS